MPMIVNSISQLKKSPQEYQNSSLCFVSVQISHYSNQQKLSEQQKVLDQRMIEFKVLALQNTGRGMVIPSTK